MVEWILKKMISPVNPECKHCKSQNVEQYRSPKMDGFISGGSKKWSF